VRLLIVCVECTVQSEFLLVCVQFTVESETVICVCTVPNAE